MKPEAGLWPIIRLIKFLVYIFSKVENHISAFTFFCTTIIKLIFKWLKRTYNKWDLFERICKNQLGKVGEVWLFLWMVP